MTFREIEDLLAFDLPPSARRHRVWWSNNPGTNVAVRAWRDAGRKTARVDMASERVVFVREDEKTTHPTPDTEIYGQLSAAAAQMVEAERARLGVDRQAAVAHLLNAFAIKRKLALVDRLAARSPADLTSGVDLIREERDGR